MISPLLSVLLMTSLYLNSYQRGIDRALKSIPLCEKHLEAVKVSSTLSSRGRATQRVIEISPFETGIDLKYTLSHECAHIIDQYEPGWDDRRALFGRPPFVSRRTYNRTTMEDFAESYAAYVVGGRLSKKKHQYIQDLIDQ